MAMIGKKDIGILLSGGFSEEDLGLIEGGVQGVEIYETPDDYFAHELISNACENGECSLMDDPKVADDFTKERYDTSRKGLYDDQEYAGNDDWEEDIPALLRGQVKFIKTVKLGKMNIWQRRNKKGEFEWPVKKIKVEIPEDDKNRYDRLSREDQKDLWVSYARDEWKKLWRVAVESLWCLEIEGTSTFYSKNNNEINLIIIPADNIRQLGYANLPSEARWITMVFFKKED